MPSIKKNSKSEGKYVIPPFYRQFQAHLSSYFKSIEHLEKAAHSRDPKKGAFLEKVNKEILTHLEEETFGTAALSETMALSRSQLYRRILALTGLAPSKYIRFFRLQLAKKLMEKESLTVGEAAYRTGFTNLSHFARVFRQQFGFHPSHFKKLCEEKISTTFVKEENTT